ncbi:DUF805 domain-containing protein [Brevundimonas sp. PAMC22021]|uniref:DUF805 domain-containing protein n=1 Tax=Brevundimonas sp. PAMC22021 TaxID=2861285 RepID=UPI001C633393|nr:DUF805 domain-containing protein [Brevundimonas sp. PAMC22021]QYF86028.1 DUF805 domain-containing protein [Brevundimonas sp. PAMC22021]
MRGEILSYDAAAGGGLISGDDGQRYGFTSSALQTPAVPAPGVRVDFVADGADARDIVILASAQTASAQPAYATAGSAGLPDVSAVDWKTLMLSFEGRIRRSHFWMAWLILLGANVVAGWLPLIGVLISLALIWPNVAITVKRLHDMGRTGWLALVPFVVAVAMFIVGIIFFGLGAMMGGGSDGDFENPVAAFAMFGPALGAFAVAALIGFAFLLWIGLTDSQPGENRFGPNPKAL